LCELINNTLVHSGASSILIRLRQAGGYLFIQYRDNGIGLAPGTSLSGHPGMGLSNIESRLRAIDGKIELNPVEGGGFSVLISCILQPADLE